MKCIFKILLFICMIYFLILSAIDFVETGDGVFYLVISVLFGVIYIITQKIH